MMVEAVRKKGLPVAYVDLRGRAARLPQGREHHPRLEAELYFYGKVFGFAPADRVDPVTIANLR